MLNFTHHVDQFSKNKDSFWLLFELKILVYEIQETLKVEVKTSTDFEE